MADQRTMAALLRAPTKGYAEAIVVPPILAEGSLSVARKRTLAFYSHLGGSCLKIHQLILPPQEQQISVMKFQTFNNGLMNHFMRHRIDTKISFVHALIMVLLNYTNLILSTLNPADQDSLNSAAGGNLLERRTQDVLTIIKKNLSQSANKCCDYRYDNYSQTVSSNPTFSFRKSIEEICVTCGGAYPYYQCLAAGGNTFPELRDNIQGYVAATAFNYNQGSGSLPSNTIANPKGELKAITTRSGIVLDRPSVPIPPPFINPEEDERVKEMDPLHSNIPYPSRMLKQKQQEEDEKMLKALLSNKEKLQELANTPLNENCSAVNLINVFNDSSEVFLKNLFSTNQPSGNPTFPSHPEITSLKVKDNIFDLEGGNVLPEKLLYLDYTKDLHPLLYVNPLSGGTTSSSSLNQLLEELADELALITFPPRNDDLQFDIEFDLKEIEYLLHYDPIKDTYSILKDSIDQSNLDDLNDNIVDFVLEMFTDEHALDYSSPPLYDEYDDDIFEVESDTKNVYDDPFETLD
nr:hypothetical protein [Tanacetum cinerariifolium]